MVMMREEEGERSENSLVVVVGFATSQLSEYRVQAVRILTVIQVRCVILNAIQRNHQVRSPAQYVMLRSVKFENSERAVISQLAVLSKA